MLEEFPCSMVNMTMPSFRRSISVVQRDGAAQNSEASSDTSPSSKLSHTRPYLALGGLLNPWGNPTDFLVVLERTRATLRGVLLQRSSRPGERSKPKGLHWKRAAFIFSVCFMFGILIGFTPFLTMDISKNFASKHQAFSFENDPTDENAHLKFVSDNREDLVLQKQLLKDKLSIGTMAEEEIKTDAVDVSYAQSSFRDLGLVPKKFLIIVTPTYARPFQSYYLNRLAHVLRVVPPPLLWIVVEMSLQSTETASILRETGVMYRHLVCDQNATTVKDLGVHQRNVALSHIEKHRLDGIVFFADDDRMYSVDLFDQMRQIRHFGTWPVAMLTKSKNKVLMEGPVCNGSEVIGWHTNQRNKISRRFHVNMSGFAFNSTILWDPKRWRRPTPEPIRLRDTVQDGFQVTTFVEQLVEDESQMEGLANGCSRVMVWHHHLEAPDLAYPSGWLMLRNLDVVVPLR